MKRQRPLARQVKISKPNRAESLHRLLPEREISIRASGESLRVKIGPAAQLSFFATGFLLLFWMTFATAVTLSKSIDRTQPAVSGEISAADGINADQESAEALIESIRILEQQVAAALELAKIAHKDKIRLELAMAEARQAPAHPSTTPAARPDENSGQVLQLLDTLETAVANLNTARDELRAQKEKNSALVESAEVNLERTRRTIARLTDAMTLASEGLESMFRNLGINPDQLKREVRSAYSGSGGLAVFIDDVGGEDADSWHREADIREALDAIDSLNVSKLAHQALPIGHPVKRSNRFTSGFGMRMHPIHKRRDFHAGADFAAPNGTPIYATGDGVVTFSGWKTAYGRTVIIRHADGIVETLYAHLSKIRVKRGERVWRSQHIADMGSTGLSTASHLHYEVRVGGQAVNPMKFIMAE